VTPLFNSKHLTLAQHLAEEQRLGKGVAPEVVSLTLAVATACKRISKAVSFGELAGVMGDHQGADGGTVNVQGETQKKLDVLANEVFIRCTEWSGVVAGLASEEMELPYQIPDLYPRGDYLLVFDPLDGSSNIDVNVSVGSIFSILRTPKDVINARADVGTKDFLQAGNDQVAAGYAIYGPTTMLVLTMGSGVYAFTLDPNSGEFLLTHSKLRIAEDTHEFAINASNNRFWPSPVKRYVDECLAGKTGARTKDFNMRWIASLVAETHRILMRGGVFLYPRDSKQNGANGRLRLLYEANPIALIVEQAGGKATTGDESVLTLKPISLHQRVGFIFGSKNEVQRLERYHLEE
jgi:fructose-1,6-bisphosphatase I / sedoheptulose-1,7-bisphosphatase